MAQPIAQRRKTLSEEVSALKRKVALNTPSPYYFRTTTTFLSGTAGVPKVDGYDVTNNFVISDTYHDNVTGDKFINNSLHITLTKLRSVYQLRMIVYVPKNPDVIYTPESSQKGLVAHPDPNSFWVLKDVYINDRNQFIDDSRQWFINLRKLQTTFNTDLKIIEKGRIRILLMYNTTGDSQTECLYLGTRLSITDK